MTALEIALVVYAGLSAVTFALYAWDKRMAQLGSHRRVRERTLRWLAWAGGFVGAIAAQVTLRHKTRRTGFVAEAWFAFFVHTALWMRWYFA